MLDFGVAFLVRNYLNDTASLADVWSAWDDYAAYQNQVATSGLGSPGPLWFVMGRIHADWAGGRCDEQQLRERFRQMLTDFGIEGETR